MILNIVTFILGYCIGVLFVNVPLTRKIQSSSMPLFEREVSSLFSTLYKVTTHHEFKYVGIYGITPVLIVGDIDPEGLSISVRGSESCKLLVSKMIN